MVPIRVLANLLVLQLSYAQKSSELVIGGAECGINEHPSLVALHNSSGFLCGGTLLNQEWVLTAAHCNMANLQISIGLHNFSGSNKDQEIRVPEQVFFCNRSHSIWDKDIMLIKLNSPVTYSTHIAPLSLPSSRPRRGSTCSIMGWGTITSPNATHPDVPHCAKIKILNDKVCERVYKKNMASSKTLCAGIITGGIDSCKGDSGGPLICDGQVQGIVAGGGKPCAQRFVPTIYTNVFEYIDWIQSTMAGNTAATCPR